jgi:hypothetical protein
MSLRAKFLGEMGFAKSIKVSLHHLGPSGAPMFLRNIVVTILAPTATSSVTFVTDDEDSDDLETYGYLD